MKTLLLHHSVQIPITKAKVDIGPDQYPYYAEFEREEGEAHHHQGRGRQEARGAGGAEAAGRRGGGGRTGRGHGIPAHGCSVCGEEGVQDVRLSSAGTAERMERVSDEEEIDRALPELCISA